MDLEEEAGGKDEAEKVELDEVEDEGEEGGEVRRFDDPKNDFLELELEVEDGRKEPLSAWDSSSDSFRE